MKMWALLVPSGSEWHFSQLQNLLLHIEMSVIVIFNALVHNLHHDINMLLLQFASSVKNILLNTENIDNGEPLCSLCITKAGLSKISKSKQC